MKKNAEIFKVIFMIFGFNKIMKTILDLPDEVMRQLCQDTYTFLSLAHTCKQIRDKMYNSVKESPHLWHGVATFTYTSIHFMEH